MAFWLLIIGTVFLQEGISTTVVLLEAYQRGYSLPIIHLVWFVGTIIQIYLAYIFGKWIQKRFPESKFEHRMKHYSVSLDESIGKRGLALALILMSSIVSPAFTSFIGSWLNISFRDILIYAFIGDLIWYTSEWITVIGASHLATLFQDGTAIVIIAIIAIALIVKVTKKKS
jgi:uncharacterized membrane protein YdjX (TVP38/TMEM64 family)